MRKIISILVTLTIFLLSVPTVFGTQIGMSDTVKAKHEFADSYAYEYVPGYDKTSENELRIQQINELQIKISTGEIEKEKGYALLEQLGVHRFETEQMSSVAVAANPQSSDVTIDAVVITYDGPTAQWTLTGCGRWNNRNWRNTVNFPSIPREGNSVSVGGNDGIGLILYNTSGTYNTTMIRSYLYADTIITSPSYKNGQKGVFFQFRDYASYISLNGALPNWEYSCRSFVISATYDSHFSDYDGYAQVQYTHTWGNCSVLGVNGLTFDGSGFALNLSNNVQTFTCYSSGDTRF